MVAMRRYDSLRRMVLFYVRTDIYGRSRYSVLLLCLVCTATCKTFSPTNAQRIIDFSRKVSSTADQKCQSSTNLTSPAFSINYIISSHLGNDVKMEERTILAINRIGGCSSCTHCQTWRLHHSTTVNKPKATSCLPSRFVTVLGARRMLSSPLRARTMCM
ncbi:hypothetical protein EDD85DRAFT_160876 [Armillaria nabsnona]|nr:hypothetical protein EDD85DRAFT_160876 [Armillaria nabsnona]